MTAISELQKMSILSTFLNYHSKNEQDVHLQRLIDAHDVERRRNRKEEVKFNRISSFKYHAMVHETRTEICRHAFLSLHSVSEKRVRRLQALLLKGEIPNDKRGKNASANSHKADELINIRDHISSFPVKESHYSGRDYKYLDSKLNKTIMFELFKEKYPDSKVTRTFYSKFFRENFSLAFGPPQVDTCCVCEELSVKIKSPSLNPAAKRVAEAELMVHKRRSKKFTKALQESTELCQQSENVVGLCFDFMMNLQLPTIPVQEMFYLRQLIVNVFGIHNIKTKRAMFYLYHEGQAKKGPDEVCSFIRDYIEENVPESTSELHLFCDNCPGQNKNHTFVRMCMALVESGRFQKIKHFFPTRGHSYLPCDRDFGVIKRMMHRTDRIYSVKEYAELIVRSCKIPHKFMVKMLETDDIMDFKNWWPLLYKKTCNSIETARRSVPRNEKENFGISSYHYFEYCAEKPGLVLASPFITSPITHTFDLRLMRPGPVTLPTNRAYEGSKVPINRKKVEDIRKVMQYVPLEFSKFYDEILSWPVDECERRHEDLE